MSSALTIAPETTSLTLVTSKPASKSAAHRIALAIVWLTVASGFFVFWLLVDALTMGLFILLPVLGLFDAKRGVVAGFALWMVVATATIVACVLARDYGEKPSTPSSRSTFMAPAFCSQASSPNRPTLTLGSF